MPSKKAPAVSGNTAGVRRGRKVRLSIGWRGTRDAERCAGVQISQAMKTAQASMSSGTVISWAQAARPVR
jgi:hypothetical protein